MFWFRLFWLCAAVLNGVVTPAFVQAQSGSVTVGGTIAGSSPNTPPLITAPLQSALISQKSTIISGDCVTDLVVKVFRNSNFVGSGLCATSGTFELPIDLLEGRNDLIARQYNTLHQPSPDSDTVTVFYAATQPNLFSDTNSSPPIAAFQLIIDYDQTIQSAFTGQNFSLPIRFSGGSAPYAVSFDWGDSTTSLFSRANTDQLLADHTFLAPGFKTITIKISDALNNQAQIQFVMLVQGKLIQSVAAPAAAIFDKLPPLTTLTIGLTVSLALGFGGGIFFSLFVRPRLPK